MLRLRFATIILLSCVWFSSIAAAQQLTREALLPDGVDIVFTISDAPKLVTALKESPVGKLMASDEMRPFMNGQGFDSFMEWLDSQNDSTSNSVDPQRWKSIKEELKKISGEVVFGFSVEDERIYTAMAMDKTEFIDAFDLDTAINDPDTKDYYLKKETFRGVDIYIRISQKKDKLAVLYLALYKGTALVANERSWIEATLTRLKQATPVDPVQDPQFRLAFQPGAIKHMLAEIDAEQKKAAEKSAGEGAKPRVDVRKVLEALELTAVQGLSLSIDMKPNRCDVTAEINHTGNTSGIWSLFSTRLLEIDRQLPYVPHDWISYGIFDLNMSELWQQVPLIVEQISPKALQMFTAGIQMVNAQLQIDLSRDFFLNLEGRGFSVSRLNENRQELLMGFELHDAPKLERVLTSLFAEDAMLRAQLASVYSQSDIKGHLVHQFTVPNAGARDGLDPELTLAFGISQGRLIFGHESLVSAFIQAGTEKGPADRFYRSTAYQKTMALLPDCVTAYSTGKFSRIAAYLMDRIKEAVIAASAKSESQAQDSPHFFKNLRFDRLPPSDFLFNFFGDSISYSQNDGATIKTKMLFFYPDPQSGS